MSNWQDSVRFSCDWCNVRVDCEYLAVFLDDIARHVPGFDPAELVELSKGQNFYARTWSYAPAGYSAITFSCSPDENGKIRTEGGEVSLPYGILVSISGDGCRFLQNLCKDGLKKLLAVCREYSHFCTRLDMAMDLFDRDNPIVPLFQEFAKHAYNTDPGGIATRGRINRSDDYVRIMPVYDRDEKKYTENVYIGDRSCSLGHCIVYNKKVEIRQGRLSSIADDILDNVGMTDNYWYRVEYRAKVNTRRRHQSLSEPAFCAFLDQGEEAAFFYICDNLFTFVDQKYDLGHIHQCPVTLVWTEFLEFLAMHVQNHNFVELQSEEGYFYVDVPLLRARKYYLKNASMVYRLMMYLNTFPDDKDLILSLGEERHCNDPTRRQFDDEILQALSAREVS